jgi:hypothetical protein
MYTSRPMVKPQDRSRLTRQAGKNAFRAHRLRIFFRRRHAKLTSYPM